MNIWISSGLTGGVTPSMLRAMIHVPLEIKDVVKFVVLSLLKGKPSTESMVQILIKLLTNWLPDGALKLQDEHTGATRHADNLSNNFFQIIGHSLHYQQVTNAYWAEHILYIVRNKGHGTKTTSGSGRTAVVESWGFFIGNTFNETKYRAIIGSPAATARADQEQFQLENQIPNDTNWQGWIPYGALHDMRDTTEPVTTGVVDNVSNYTISGIFRGFNTSSATIPQLRDQILLNNGNWQAPQVNQLITSYRW